MKSIKYQLKYLSLKINKSINHLMLLDVVKHIDYLITFLSKEFNTDFHLL